MTVLVTGGSGFIGSWVIRDLLDRGETAVIYDLYPRSDQIQDIVDRVNVVRGDLLDLGHLLETMKSEGVDRVIHAASYLGYQSEIRPPLAVKVNCEGTANVLEASRHMDVKRVVFTSTQSVYGITPPGQPVNEDMAPSPTTVYGATKRLCEWLGFHYQDHYGLDFLAVRFPTVYGPTKTGRGWRVPVTDLVENPLTGNPVSITAGGAVKQEWLYVTDAARTLANACLVEETEHRLFNLGSSESYSLLDLAEIVKARIPGAVIEIGGGPDMLYGLGGRIDDARAAAELEHRSTLDIQQGIDEWISVVRARVESG